MLATLSGIGLGIFLIGVAVGLLISSQRSGSETQSARQPKLRLSMAGANIFIPDAMDMHNRFTGIGINAKVWNTGAPSVATEWLLFVIPENGTPVVGQLTAIPESLRLGGAVNSTIIRASDSLESKTKNTQVQTTPIEGTLLFYVAMKKEVVQAPSTRLELIVKDINGEETKATQLIGDWLQR